MEKDRFIGLFILIGSAIGVTGYFYLIFWSPWVILTLQISVFIAVTAILLILAWIGYTLATTPPPKSISEIENLEEQTELTPIVQKLPNERE